MLASWAVLGEKDRMAYGSTYWSGLFEQLLAEKPVQLWRQHSDSVNGALVDRWLPHSCQRLLKTDLFDEVFGEGLLPRLQARADRLIGLDVSPSIARGARQRHPLLEVLVADVCALPFRDASFDAVISNSTLDHFETEGLLLQGLAELARVLQPGGRLVVTLDNASHPVVALRNQLPYQLLRRLGLVPYFVGRTFSLPRLQAELRNCGLRVLEGEYILHCPRVACIPLTRAAQTAPPRWQTALLKALRDFESLGHLPTRRWTGHFACALAEKP